MKLPGHLGIKGCVVHPLFPHSRVLGFVDLLCGCSTNLLQEQLEVLLLPHAAQVGLTQGLQAHALGIRIDQAGHVHCVGVEASHSAPVVQQNGPVKGIVLEDLLDPGILEVFPKVLHEATEISILIHVVHKELGARTEIHVWAHEDTEADYLSVAVGRYFWGPTTDLRVYGVVLILVLSEDLQDTICFLHVGDDRRIFLAGAAIHV
mmetsp:Transcript_105215/g.250472  ORF Transcript_105215/g.250472 Transcript_105215/m.250472 type:complete len:206 (-) Transcript_105215:311-928(-)